MKKPAAPSKNARSPEGAEKEPSVADEPPVEIVTVAYRKSAAEPDDGRAKANEKVEAAKPPVKPAESKTAPNKKAPTEKKLAAASILSRTVSAIKRHAVTLVSAAASLAVGIGIGLTQWSTPEFPQVVIAPAVDQEIKFVSIDSRRHEPIQPVMPFADLDSQIVALGNRLFHDPGLSGNGKLSCASCHDPSHGGIDGRARSIGASGQVGEFNAPSVLTAAGNFAQSWTGGAITLEQYLELHLVEPNRMLSSWERVTKFLNSEPTYTSAFEKHMAGPPDSERIRSALATYVRSLMPINSDFDRWLEGQEDALSSDAFGGYFLFKKYSCISCHQGPGVGGRMYQPLGSMKDYFVDSTPTELQGRFRVTGRELDRHVFRVPQLRIVAHTAPYFHDGATNTLEEAVAAMIQYQCKSEVNPEDVRRLVAFLKTL